MNTAALTSSDRQSLRTFLILLAVLAMVLLWSTATVAQAQYVISGVVRDQNAMGMSGVTVALSGTLATSTTTANDGSFSFPSAAAGGSYTVSASLNGFQFSPPTQTFFNLSGNRTANFTGSTVTYTIMGVAPTWSTLSLNGAGARLTVPFASGDYFFSDLHPGDSYTVSMTSFQAGIEFSRRLPLAPFSQTVLSLNQDTTLNFSGLTLDYSVGGGAYGVAIGDFNADGKSDVAVASSNGVIRVFLGIGRGALSGPTTFTVGSNPGPVLARDFNRDGKIDLVTANLFSNNISVLIGVGDGTFLPARNLAVDTEPVDMAVADVNGDAIWDVITVNHLVTSGHTISVLLGIGDGTFGAASTFGSSASTSLAVGDINGDSKPDLVTANQFADSVGVLLGNGNGTFQNAVDFPVGTGPYQAAVGDVNGDGKLDVITVNRIGCSVSVLLGNGAGALANATDYTAGVNPRGLAVADFNGDGKLDLAVASSAHAVTTLRGNGDGTFQPALDNPTAAGDPYLLASGDLNQDGRTDLAVSVLTSGLVSIMLNVISDAAPVKIAGHLTTANANPISGATVSLTGSQTGSTTTDANGSYLFSNLPAGGTYLVSPSKTFYRFTPQGQTFDTITTDQNRDFTGTLITPSIVGRIIGANGLGLSGVTVSLSGSQAASTTSNANGTYSFLSLTAGGNYVVTPSLSGRSFIPASRTINNLSGDVVVDFQTASNVQLAAASVTVNEEAGEALVMITRTGDTTVAASVNYSTSDTAAANNCNVINHIASSRCDYLTTLGTLRFAAGETSKTISIPIVDDVYAEGSEGFTIALLNPSGATLGSPATAAITITENDNSTGTNPIDTAAFFVRQHYVDFLNREPDASGLAFWTDQITSCGSDSACVEVRRINVSAAFYLSIEFQDTGYLVERLYKASYGDVPGTSTFGGSHQLQVPIVRLNEFLSDTQEIGQGVIVGQTGWEQALENNKQAFILAFVQRSRFNAAFPTSTLPGTFVDKLFLNAGVTPSAAERQAAINEFSSAPTIADAAARARALRLVADNSTLKTVESNRAFVLMQFFGYLRRNPNDPQDVDYTGYDFWSTKLNQFNGNFQSAEMVKAFITSAEYRQRFGP